jgi:Sulfotransferase domain
MQWAMSSDENNVAQAVLDVPAVLFAEELIAAYPDAKIILTNRNVDSWYKSCSKTVFRVTSNPAVRVLKHLDPTFLGPWAKLA